MSWLLRWRYLVVVTELGVAGTLGLWGWHLVGGTRPRPAAVVVRAAAPGAAAAAAASVPLPWVGGLPGPSPQAAGIVLGGRLLSDLGREDVALYRTQWQTVTIVLEAIRGYSERRLLPELLGAR